MVNRKSFPASLFGVAFIAALLLAAPPSHAAMQTFEKEYTYTASELDSKSSCRAIALEQVKRILLQELGVYVESVFNDKASSDGRTKDEVRREITTLSAGVASTEVVEEKWDGTTYWLKARIKADPDDVAKKIEALRQDKQKVAELEESRKRAAELSQELERMRKELDATKSAAAKAEQVKKYNDTAQQLIAFVKRQSLHGFHPLMTDLDNGTVRNEATGLFWQKEDDGEDGTWNSSKSYCSTLVLGGFKDWRLPTIDELESIIKSDIKMKASNYWSSNICVTKTSWARTINFGELKDDCLNKAPIIISVAYALDLIDL